MPGKTYTEKALILKQCGFDAISIFCDENDWKNETLKELKSLYDNTGVTVCEICLVGKYYGQLNNKSAIIRNRAKDLYKKSIELANELEAITEFEFSCSSQDILPLYNPYLKMSKSDEYMFFSIIDELCSYVEAEGSLLLEPLNRYESLYLNTVEDCVSLLKSVNNSKLGILFDVFHSSIEEKSLVDVLKNAKSYIKHIHIADNNRLLPGYGCIDWKALMMLLNDNKYNGYLAIEAAYLEKNFINDVKQVLTQLKGYL